MALEWLFLLLPINEEKTKVENQGQSTRLSCFIASNTLMRYWRWKKLTFTVTPPEIAPNSDSQSSSSKFSQTGHIAIKKKMNSFSRHLFNDCVLNVCLLSIDILNLSFQIPYMPTHIILSWPHSHLIIPKSKTSGQIALLTTNFCA